MSPQQVKLHKHLSIPTVVHCQMPGFIVLKLTILQGPVGGVWWKAS